MPTVNIFYANDTLNNQLNGVSKDLKTYIAQELSGSNISLDVNEVSIRLIKTDGDGMLADVELEVTAHAFQDRIDHQDEICIKIRKFLKDKLDVPEIRVWLLLPQLGHSWE